MSTRVVDLNADVAAIRRLRAAAVLPQFAALCCVLFAVLFGGVGIAGWKTMAVLSGIAAVLIATARAVERGAVCPRMASLAPPRAGRGRSQAVARRVEPYAARTTIA